VTLIDRDKPRPTALVEPTVHEHRGWRIQLLSRSSETFGVAFGAELTKPDGTPEYPGAWFAYQGSALASAIAHIDRQQD
jgi:hypothetical protein